MEFYKTDQPVQPAKHVKGGRQNLASNSERCLQHQLTGPRIALPGRDKEWHTLGHFTRSSSIPYIPVQVLCSIKYDTGTAIYF